MKLQLYYFAVVLYFFKDFGSTNAINNFSLVSMRSAISNLLRYTEKTDINTCDNSSGNITQILEYIKMGEEDIERTDVEDIVIVLGASGVGKSTLVQFVANETNSLRGNCTAIECKIVDDSETIGENIISKAFLPYLVFHNSSNTPFYDMPGFNDNRSPEMEIANWFFMQQILTQAKRIKILILARFFSFTTSARQDFKILLKNLADLVKSPEKFKGGMGIIATAAEAIREEHQGFLDSLSNFLNYDVLPALEDLFAGYEDYYIDRSKAILQNIDPDRYLSYFLSPKQNGPILNAPRMVENQIQLNKVIYDNLRFINKDDADFGLPLSVQALQVFSEMGYCILDSLVKKMDNFATELSFTIEVGLLKINEANPEQTQYLMDLVTSMMAADFSFDSTDRQILSMCLKKLLKQISNLQIPSLTETQQQVSDTMKLVNFIEQTQQNIQFDPDLWVKALNSIHPNLVAKLEESADKLQVDAWSSLVSLSKQVASNVIAKIDLLKDVEEKKAESSSMVVSLEFASILIDNEEIKTGQNLKNLLTFYLSQLDELTGSSDCSSIPEFKALSIYEILDDFGWAKKNWTNSFVAGAFDTVKNERDLNIFLSLLFNDLSHQIFQTGPRNQLQIWWYEIVHQEITEGNFDQLHNLISGPEFSAGDEFDRSRAKYIVFFRPKGVERLKFLLDFMNKDLPCSDSVDLVITGPIISFDRAMECARKKIRTKVTLIGTHIIYANSKIIGKEINNKANIQVILMSNDISVINGGGIDLSGIEEEEGNDGHPAGRQYALYQRISNEGGTILSPNVKGGQGGIGLRGAQGSEGTTGTNEFNERSNDCAAWAGEKIQIRNYVNGCNERTTSGEPQNSNEYCHAGDNGILVDIYGKVGGVGENGGTGGKGFSGGSGGESYSVLAKNFSKPPVHTVGDQGEHGKGGPGGPGGLGGRNGPTIFMRIDDRGTSAKYCESLTESRVDSEERGNSGRQGAEGPQGDTVYSKIPINTDDVNRHFQSLKVLLTQLDRNEFLSSQSAAFLDLIKTGTPF